MKHSKDKALPTFEEFVNEEFMAAGFGPAQNTATTYSTGGAIPTTGYSMQPIAGKIDDLGEACANEACTYEQDEHPDHKGDDYINEVKNHVCSKIDEAYNKKKTW